jgi:hypothetical protein
MRSAAWLLAAFVLLGAASPRPDEKAALVTVIAEAAAPVRELTARDFIVKEGGKKLDVTDAHLASGSLSVALLVDIAQPAPGMPMPTSELRAGTAAFVKAVLTINPDAQISLWQVASAAMMSVDFTSKGADLESPIAHLYSSQQTSAVLLEALHAAGKQIAGRPGTRRAIVSVDFDSPEGSTGSMIQQSADSLTNSGATLWALSVRGSSGTASAQREDVLEKMTKATGGRRYRLVAASALEPRLKNIAASLTSQYVVTFTRAGDGALKPLTFETTGGLKVLATPFMR